MVTKNSPNTSHKKNLQKFPEFLQIHYLSSLNSKRWFFCQDNLSIIIYRSSIIIISKLSQTKPFSGMASRK